MFTAFIFSAFILFLAKNKGQLEETSFFQGALLFFVVLKILKPVFSLPFFVFLGLVFPVFYLKKYLKTPKLFLPLLLILLPVFIQITVVKIKSGEMKVSTIGSHTLEMYFLTQGIEKLKKASYNTAYAQAKSFDKTEQRIYLMKNGKVYLRLFKDNIINNSQGYITFLNFPKTCEKPSWSEFAEEMNKRSYYLHQVSALIILPILLVFFFIRKEYENLIVVFSVTIMSCYYIVTTGIRFDQGDRLVSPSIAISAFLYPLATYYLIDLLKNRRSINYRGN
jgi:4-amino-4-deoxy-L-arabinose transferase-like glycosyltransferase